MPFIPNIGPVELIIILVIALVVLGPGKLPDVAQSLGKSVREFRKAATDIGDAASLDPERGNATGAGTAAAPAQPSDPTAGASTTTPAANTLTQESAPNTLSAPPAPTPTSPGTDTDRDPAAS
jgi:TatA/E family protein of Tat protein translocase